MCTRRASLLRRTASRRWWPPPARLTRIRHSSTPSPPTTSETRRDLDGRRRHRVRGEAPASRCHPRRPLRRDRLGDRLRLDHGPYRSAIATTARRAESAKRSTPTRQPQWWTRSQQCADPNSGSAWGGSPARTWFGWTVPLWCSSGSPDREGSPRLNGPVVSNPQPAAAFRRRGHRQACVRVSRLRHHATCSGSSTA